MTDPTGKTNLDHDPDPQDLIDAGNYDPHADDDEAEVVGEADPSYVPLPPVETL